MHLPFDSNLSLIYQQHHPHSNPEKQKLSGPVTGAGSRRTEASGGVKPVLELSAICSCFLSGQPTCCMQNVVVIIHSAGDE